MITSFELSSDIAYKTGQIQGTVRFLTIVKDLPRKDIEKSLDRIFKWANEINEIDQLEKQVQVLKQKKRIITSRLFKFKRIDLTLKTLQDELEQDEQQIQTEVSN